MWCKINKFLKYYEYQLTKRCLGERLEGFKVSSWFLKITKLVEYRIPEKLLYMVALSLFTRLPLAILYLMKPVFYSDEKSLH